MGSQKRSNWKLQQWKLGWSCDINTLAEEADHIARTGTLQMHDRSMRTSSDEGKITVRKAFSNRIRSVQVGTDRKKEYTLSPTQK